MSSSQKNGHTPVEQSDQDSLRIKPRMDSKNTDLDEHLNRAIAQMGRDVPPMPDSFRLGWRQAVRQDQKNLSKTNQSQQSAESPAHLTQLSDKVISGDNSKNAGSVKAETKEKFQIQKLLGVAALAVFILGAAMLVRPSLFAAKKNVSFSRETNALVQEFTAASDTGLEYEEEMAPIEETDPVGDEASMAAGSLLYSSWASENNNSGSFTDSGTNSPAKAAAFSALPSSVPDPGRDYSVPGSPEADYREHTDTSAKISDSNSLAGATAETSMQNNVSFPIRITGLVLIAISLFIILLFRKKRQ